MASGWFLLAAALYKPRAAAWLPSTVFRERRGELGLGKEGEGGEGWCRTCEFLAEEKDGSGIDGTLLVLVSLFGDQHLPDLLLVFFVELDGDGCVFSVPDDVIGVDLDLSEEGS